MTSPAGHGIWMITVLTVVALTSADPHPTILDIARTYYNRGTLLRRQGDLGAARAALNQVCLAVQCWWPRAGAVRRYYSQRKWPPWPLWSLDGVKWMELGMAPPPGESHTSTAEVPSAVPDPHDSPNLCRSHRALAQTWCGVCDTRAQTLCTKPDP